MKYNLLLLFILVLSSCSNDDPEPVATKSSAKEITEFIIEDVETEIEGNTITIYAPASLSSYRFIPQIKRSANSSISPQINLAVDFTNSVDFVVTAQDGTTNTYSTKLVILEGLEEVVLTLKSIDSYLIDKYRGEIDELNHKIQINYSGKVLNSARSFDFHPFLEIKTSGDWETFPSENDTIDPADKNLKFTIPDLNKSYDLSIQNQDNFFKLVNLPLFKKWGFGQKAGNAFDEFRSGLDDNDYIFHTLKNQDLTNIKPDTIIISDYATIIPDQSIAHDFSQDVSYTITSETGVESVRKVRVIEKHVIFPNDTNNSGTVSNDANWFTRYVATSKIVEITLVNRETNETLACQILQNYETDEGDNYLILEVMQMPTSRTSYFYRCMLEEGITVDSYGGITLDPNGN